MARYNSNNSRLSLDLYSVDKSEKEHRHNHERNKQADVNELAQQPWCDIHRHRARGVSHSDIYFPPRAAAHPNTAKHKLEERIAIFSSTCFRSSATPVAVNRPIHSFRPAGLRDPSR